MSNPYEAALEKTRQLTEAQKIECLALAEMMNSVGKTEGGRSFMTTMFMSWAIKAGMHVLPIDHWRAARDTIIDLHVQGILTEGQTAKTLGLDRVAVRKFADEARP